MPGVLTLAPEASRTFLGFCSSLPGRNPVGAGPPNWPLGWRNSGRPSELPLGPWPHGSRLPPPVLQRAHWRQGSRITSGTCGNCWRR